MLELQIELELEQQKLLLQKKAIVELNANSPTPSPIKPKAPTLESLAEDARRQTPRALMVEQCICIISEHPFLSLHFEVLRDLARLASVADEGGGVVDERMHSTLPLSHSPSTPPPHRPPSRPTNPPTHLSAYYSQARTFHCWVRS